MRNRRSRRLAAAALAAGAFALVGVPVAYAAPARPATGVAPLCVVMPQTQGCNKGPVQG